MDSPETLADIAIFAAVIREGSFTRAADKSELSTLGQQVRQPAGTKLGARLLHRTTRRLRLTEAGSALYENSSTALAAIEDAKLAVSKLQVHHGKLKISTSTAFGTMQPRVIRDLSAQYPELEVELVLEDRHVDLVKEGIDVAIRITGEAPDSGLVYRKLAPNRQVICALAGLHRTPWTSAYARRLGEPQLHRPQRAHHPTHVASHGSGRRADFSADQRPTHHQ